MICSALFLRALVVNRCQSYSEGEACVTIESDLWIIRNGNCFLLAGHASYTSLRWRTRRISKAFFASSIE